MYHYTHAISSLSIVVWVTVATGVGNMVEVNVEGQLFTEVAIVTLRILNKTKIICQTYTHAVSA